MKNTHQRAVGSKGLFLTGNYSPCAELAMCFTAMERAPARGGSVTRRVLCESWLYTHPVQIVINELCHFNAWFLQSEEIYKCVLCSAETSSRQGVGIFSPFRGIT